MKSLNLPVSVAALVKAQNDFNLVMFADQFADDAVVHDEAKIYNGRKEIQEWNEETTKKYSAKLFPENYTGDAAQGILQVDVSGSFPGSPISLTYNMTFENNKIKTLAIS